MGRTRTLSGVLALVVLAAATGCGAGKAPAASSADATTSSTPSPYRVVPANELLARPKEAAVLPEPVFELKHGGTYTALYFAALDGPEGGQANEAYQAAADAMDKIDEQLRRRFGGRYFGNTVSNCDLGAESALNGIGIGSPVLYISLHFATQDDGKKFSDALAPGPLTMATVQTFCRD